MRPISCLFYYEKLALSRGGGPIKNADGSNHVNPNYISFLQVISTYWAVDEATGKEKLNIFMNGGSVSKDRDTGEVTMKAGYTIVLPDFLGRPFMEQYYTWSCAFGLSAASHQITAPARRSEAPRSTTGHAHSGRAVREEEFINPDSVAEEGEVVVEG